jgi:hypothetical protein
MKADRPLRSATSRFAARAAPHKHSPLKVVGVYADLPLRALAMRVLGDVACQCSGVCELSSVWWSFDTLNLADVRQAAARAAAEADMIWFAADAGEVLPDAVQQWIEAWSPHRTSSDGALVALMRCPPDYAIEQSHSYTCLRGLARAVGLDFFLRRFDSESRPSVITQPPSSLPNSRLTVQNDPNRGQARWWGINE